MNHKQKVGKFGEQLAANYLLKRGYKVIAKNVQTGHKEIDIIARQGKRLVFVEVKTRTSLRLGSAELAFTFRKFNNFKRALMLYIRRNNLDEKRARADLISIDVNKAGGSVRIKHYKNII